jgi:hypothetical protein
MPNGNTGFHIQICFSEISLFLISIKSACEINRVAIKYKSKGDCCTSRNVLFEMHIKEFCVFGS